MTKFYYILISTILLLCTTYLLNAQERDPRTRTYISPARVVWQSDAGVRLSDVLLKPGNGQAYCNNDTPESYCIMKSGHGVHPAILLDYGKELHGGLQLVTGPIGDPVKVRVRYGESASEAMSEVGGKGGATTFWEDFNLDWLPNAAGIDELVPEGKKDIHGDFGAYCYLGFRHSLCHGWASGPTAWLSHHVLGIEILEPGCTKVRITPHLGDLAWVEGSFPTPYGPIKVRHEKLSDGSIHTEVSVPDGVEVDG